MIVYVTLLIACVHFGISVHTYGQTHIQLQISETFYISRDKFIVYHSNQIAYNIIILL